MQTGEVLRRVVFDLLDAAKGGRLKKLKEVNKREIVEGVTEEYMDRRIHVLLDYVKEHSPYYKDHPEWTELKTVPSEYKWFYRNTVYGTLRWRQDEPCKYELYLLYGTERFPYGNEARRVPCVDKGKKYDQ